MKRKDGEGSEHLQIICYDAFFTDTASDDYPFKDEVEKMKWLEKVGFTTSPLKVFKTPDEVIDYRALFGLFMSGLLYQVTKIFIHQFQLLIYA